jgi:hypothetical protein
MLTKAGFSTLNLRSSMGTKKNRVIEQFNDPQSDIQAMVTPVISATYGPNLQTACHKGVLIQLLRSGNTIWQPQYRRLRHSDALYSSRHPSLQMWAFPLRGFLLRAWT